MDSEKDEVKSPGPEEYEWADGDDVVRGRVSLEEAPYFTVVVHCHDGYDGNWFSALLTDAEGRQIIHEAARSKGAISGAIRVWKRVKRHAARYHR